MDHSLSLCSGLSVGLSVLSVCLSIEVPRTECVPSFPPSAGRPQILHLSLKWYLSEIQVWRIEVPRTVCVPFLILEYRVSSKQAYQLRSPWKAETIHSDLHKDTRLLALDMESWCPIHHCKKSNMPICPLKLFFFFLFFVFEYQ